MLGFEGRHVVASSSGNRLLFAAFEHSVVVRDLVHGTQSAQLETTFDFGGRRLALSDELDAVVAAAYAVHGLALYSRASAKRLLRWSLDQGDVIDSLSLGEPIACCFALGGEIVVTTEGDILDTATATAGKPWSS